MHTLLSLDASLSAAASSLTASYPAVALLTYICAQLLVLIFPLALVILWYRPELRSRHHAARKAVVLAVMGVVVALAVKGGISLIWTRERPFVADPSVFHLVNLGLDPASFPSGHTMVATVIAASLLLSGFRRWGVFLAVLAVLVGLGRVFAGVHYPSDVLGGALIGIVTAAYLHREAGSLKQYLPDE